MDDWMTDSLAELREKAAAQGFFDLAEALDDALMMAHVEFANDAEPIPAPHRTPDY